MSITSVVILAIGLILSLRVGVCVDSLGYPMEIRLLATYCIYIPFYAIAYITDKK
jgi:hypothetical protein